MRKFLVLVCSLFLITPLLYAQSKKSEPVPVATPKQFKDKKYGSGEQPKPTTEPKKTYGSGDPKPVAEPKKADTGPPPVPDKKPEPKKTYGSDIPTTPKGKSYGSGGEKPSTKPDVGKKPQGQYDQKASSAQQHAESKKKFQAGQNPAPTYTDPGGKAHKIDPKDVKIENLRKQLSEERVRNRDLRERNFYERYHNRPPPVVYHDCYSSLFWLWLLDRSIEEQALWAYHHRHTMDAARYNDMLAKNAALADRVKQLEAQKLVRNETYAPKEMSDSDLMYNKEFVHAVYNPTPAQTSSEISSGIGYVVLIILVSLVIVCFVVWLIFVKRW